MKLRAASASDVETLFEIRCSVGENHQSREELATLGITVESVKAMIAGGGYITTIAEVPTVGEDRPVGFTMAQISEAYIFACFVRPGFEGLGIGRALMEAAEMGLRRAGVRQAWLSTGPEPGLRARGFYRHLGWLEDGHLEDGQIRFIKPLKNSS
ncbi:MAG: GNAT family N-acetyltransferase [Cyanobacteria bacterium J06641_5]